MAKGKDDILIRFIIAVILVGITISLGSGILIWVVAGLFGWFYLGPFIGKKLR